MAHFGENLGIVMKSRDVGVKELADGTGISETAIRKYLDGKGDLKVNTLLTIAQFLKVAPDRLYQGWTSKPEGNGQRKPEDYADLIEGRTEYTIVPRGALFDHYRLVLKEETDYSRGVFVKLIEEKDRVIERLQAENVELKARAQLNNQ